MEKENNNLSFPRNVVGNLPLSKLFMKEDKQLCFNEKVEDPRVLAGRATSGMTALFDDNIKAFTLIELLVVVLIIGILAAVALPKYQMAVDKSRLVQLVTMATAIKQAEERYYLAEGKYASSWELLDIDIDHAHPHLRVSLPGVTGSANSPCILGVGDTRLPDVKLYFGTTVSGNSVWNDLRTCYASKTNERANQLCQQVTGKKTPSNTDNTTNKYYF